MNGNILIKNGTVVTASDIFIADVLVKDGKIQNLGKNLNFNNIEVLDATGKYILPGGIDVHTHLDLDVGIARAVDDFYTGTLAAAHGGTTTIVDHLGFGPKNCDLKHQIDVYHGLAKDKAVIDYGFHGVLQHVNQEVLDSMEALIVEGITSYKLYMTYDYKLDDKDIFEVMKRIKDLDLMITVHPENDGIIKALKEYFVNDNKLSPIYHAKSRPEECETEAINRMMTISKIIGDVPLYIVHTSSASAVQCIKNAKESGLQNLFIETCPQYLFLNDELYNREDGLKFIMSPPLRDKRNNELLWKNIINGDIDTIATDHCPFNYEKEKQLGKNDFTKCPNGAPGVELRMPLMISEAIKNRLSLNKVVEICCTNPAKLFGMYPKKGTIAIGSDADMIIVDADFNTTIIKDILHENVDYTPYEGIDLSCKIDYTISRGEIIIENGKFMAEKGRGEFIKRNKPIL